VVVVSQVRKQVHMERILARSIASVLFALVAFVYQAQLQAQDLSFYDSMSSNSKFKIDLGLIYSQGYYDLSGQGFTANSGTNEGAGYLARAEYHHPKASYFIEYLSVTQELTSPTGISPREIDASLERYAIYVEPQTDSDELQSAQKSSFAFQYGLEVRRRSADKTTPNVYMPTRSTAGPRAHMAYRASLNDLTSLNLNLGIFLPLYIEERGRQTGYYKYSLNPELGFSLIRKIGSQLDVSIGARVFYETNYFAGTGERGTTKAKETYLDTIFPVEFRFKF
jgi:hypothetical protein